MTDLNRKKNEQNTAHEKYGLSNNSAKKSGSSFYGAGGLLNQERNRVRAINAKLNGEKSVGERAREIAEQKRQAILNDTYTIKNGNEIPNMKRYDNIKLAPRPNIKAPIEQFPSYGPLTEYQTNLLEGRMMTPVLWNGTEIVPMEKYKKFPRHYPNIQTAWSDKSIGSVAVDGDGKVIPLTKSGRLVGYPNVYNMPEDLYVGGLRASVYNNPQADAATIKQNFQGQPSKGNGHGTWAFRLGNEKTANYDFAHAPASRRPVTLQEGVGNLNAITASPVQGSAPVENGSMLQRSFNKMRRAAGGNLKSVIGGLGAAGMMSMLGGGNASAAQQEEPYYDATDSYINRYYDPTVGAWREE